MDDGHDAAAPFRDDFDIGVGRQTGTPPNNKTPDEKSFTSASSKFKSPQDWLAGRDLSAKAALAQGIDVDAKEIKPPFKDQPTAVDFVVEHGRDIDEAFIGLKKNLKPDPGGPPVDDKTYDSYEELTGLTRSYVNWTWEFDAIDVPKDPLDPDGPKETVKPKSIQAYEDAFKLANKGNAPATIKGRWVMMQQFPLAEGWDNTLKAYKDTPKGLIP